jgi:type IV secretion system protein TrbL
MSVGAKLFMLELILGLGQRMVLQWTNRFPDADNVQRTDVFVMVGMAIVLLALAKQIPDTVQGLINGTHVGSGSAIVGAAAAVAGGAASVAGAVTGTGAAVGGALKLAREQVAAGEAKSVFGQAARNFGGAVVADVGARLSGRAHHGHMPWRMSQGMRAEAEQMKEKRLAAEKEQGERTSAAPGQPASSTSATSGGSGGERNVVRPASSAKDKAGSPAARRGFKRAN